MVSQCILLHVDIKEIQFPWNLIREKSRDGYVDKGFLETYNSDQFSSELEFLVYV